MRTPSRVARFAPLRVLALLAALALLLPRLALADSYADTLEIFRKAGESAAFFGKSYGYAVFPTVGKGGLGVGGGYGKGRVYQGGRYIGDTSVLQLSVGFQAGGQAYSEIIFFQDRRALQEFTSGNFEFDATVGATAVTAGASAAAGTTAPRAGASADRHDARTVGDYYRGMAVFTVVKGGLMYEATVAGQKFSYNSRSAH